LQFIQCKTKFIYFIMSKLYYLILIFLGFSSCKNEIKIAAPWKETVIVYGLLDPGASVNYLRIQKAFLDPDGNAFQFTQNPDSIYPSNLAVKLFVRLNGNIVDTIYPVLINGDLEGIKKDSGLFAQTPNYLYKISEPIKDSRLINSAVEDYEYELIIQDPKTGYQCNAKTFTTGVMQPQTPVVGPKLPLTIRDQTNSFMTIAYIEGRKVKSYDMVIRFWYKEKSISNPNDSSIKFMNWFIFKNRLTSSNLEGYRLSNSAVPGSVFYEILNATIKPNKNIKREAMYCDIEYFGAGEDLFTYIEVNIPSIGIVQKKPEYSNVTNGLGIFSSRFITSSKNVPISPEMKSILKSSDYTVGLNF